MVDYDMQNQNNELVSSSAPLLTILTPGLGSGAKAWSNDNNYFTYCEDSATYKTVTIRAVYKYDMTKIANITFTVYKDTDANLNNPIILHKYGMDVRDNNLVGTEVSSGLGNIINVSYMPAVSIHTGYTRLITLGDDGLSQVIRHYDWSIDRKTGETGQGEVSSYGTICVIVGGTLTIKGVYKYNPRYVIYITVEFV